MALDYMTIEQIVTAAENDAARQQENGRLRSINEDCGDDEENIYTLTSLYSQWAENEAAAEDAIWTMFKEKFSKFLS
jgi:hypothetical protein